MAPYLPQLGTVLLLLEPSVSNPVTKTKKVLQANQQTAYFFCIIILKCLCTF